MDVGGATALEPGLRPAEPEPVAMHASLDLWVEPPRLLATLLFDARRRGARIETGRRVTGLQVDGGRVRGVVTPEGVLSSEAVVLAAGAAAPALAAAARVPVPMGR